MEGVIERWVNLTYRAGLQALFVGPTGIGKTARIMEALRGLGLPVFAAPPLSTLKPEHLLGMGVVYRGEGGRPAADWVQFRFWADLTQAARRGRVALFLDEINRARPEVQDALLQLVAPSSGVRRVGNEEVPAENVFIVAAANPATYLVQESTEALLHRFVVVHVGPEPDVWTEWAAASGVHPLVVGFIRENPDALVASEEKVLESVSALRPTPNYRTWEYCSRVLQAAGVPESGDLAALGLFSLAEAAVGPEAAQAFAAWAASARNLPSPQDLLAGKATLPESPGMAYVAVTRVVGWVEEHASPAAPDEVVRLFKAAASWPPDLVAGVMLPRMRDWGKRAKWADRSWVLSALAHPEAEEFLLRHGDVVQAVFGLGGR